MKKTLTQTTLVLLLCSVLFISSCVKTSNLAYVEPLHQVCLANPLDSAHVESFETEITTATVRQVFAAQNVVYDESKINTVSLVSLKATIPNGGTFDNIESIRLLIKLAGANSDIEIAHSQYIYPGDSTIFLVPNTAELKTFISELSILTLKVATKTPASGAVCIDFTEGALKAEINK